MHLDQFEKLKHLVEKLVESHRETNFKLVRLQRENAELKKRLEAYNQLPEQIEDGFLNEIITENERLKNKNQLVQTQLAEIVTRLENRLQRQPGVDS